MIGEEEETPRGPILRGGKGCCVLNFVFLFFPLCLIERGGVLNHFVYELSPFFVWELILSSSLSLL